jgi:acyl-coenzyme A synthetase/AMP-(fatty) acid ligase
MSNILGYLFDQARRGGWLDRPAVTDESTGVTLTHRDIYRAAGGLSRQLEQGRLRAGDRVGLCVGDRPEWMVAFLACAAMGAVAVLVNPDLRATTLAGHYQLGGAQTVLEYDGEVIRLTRLGDAVTLGGWRLADLLGQSADPAPIADLDNDILYVQFSSGSTGAAKAITHRTSDLVHYFAAVAAPDWLAIGPDDVIVSVSQFYFAYGFNNQFVYPLFAGAHVVVRPRRRGPQELRDAAHVHRATLLFGVPSALAGLPRPSHRSATLRAIVSAGEPLPAVVEDRLRENWGVPVFEQIGCTEVGNAFCANGFGHSVPRSAGLVCDGYKVAVRPSHMPHVAAMNTCSPHRVGEIWVSGPTIPEQAQTAKGTVPLLIDGWLPTRDYGYFDDNGALVVLGRCDDILLVGGICVSAVRIESEILASSMVRDAAVATSVENSGKSRLVAYIAPADATADELMSQEAFTGTLRDHLRDRVERYEIPKEFTIVTEIPRTPSGKVQRHLLGVRS